MKQIFGMYLTIFLIISILDIVANDIKIFGSKKEHLLILTGIKSISSGLKLSALGGRIKKEGT